MNKRLWEQVEAKSQTVYLACPKCNGSGKYGDTPFVCYRCDGRGYFANQGVLLPHIREALDDTEAAAYTRSH